MPAAIHKIHYTSHYLKAYNRLSKRIQESQDEKEHIFIDSPFHSSLKTHKLKGKYKQFYAYSVAYQWRVLFRFVRENEVIFYDIGAHSIYQ